MWVLIRGLARESGHWGNFPQLLGSKLGVIPLSVNLPGCGDRNAERAGGSVPELLEQMRSEIPRDEKKVLVGVSLGGMVALQWAQQYPQEVSAVVIINSSARNLNYSWERFRPEAVRTLLAAALSKPAEREQKILQLVCNSENVRRRYLPTFKALAEHRPVARRNFAKQLRAAYRFSAGKISPAVPGLVAVSDADRLASPRCSRALAAYYEWPLVAHPTGGHDLALEDPAWLADQITAHFGHLCRKR
jgi:pimeloyl-ACP methyl ester carboxylesterase